MRVVVWFVAGFSAACALGVYLQIDDLALLFAIAYLILAAAAGLLRRQRFHGTIAMMCLGLALGLIWFRGYDEIYLQPIRTMDEKIQSVTITATDFSQSSTYGAQVDGRIEVDGRSYKVRLYLKQDAAVCPGDKLTGRVRIRLTDGSGREEPIYYRTEGIFLLATQTSAISTVPAQKLPWYGIPAVLRRNVLSLLEQVFPSREAAFAKALLLGARSELDYETTTAFRVSGVSHVVAVSGLHISILLNLMYTLTGRRRWLTGLLGIPVLILFAAMAGFTPSVTRAVVMQSLYLLALLTVQEYDQPTALAVAVLLMLAVNPMVIASISFQLSIGCMAGILVLNAPVRKHLCQCHFLGSFSGNSLGARVKRWLVNTTATTVSVTILTTPLIAGYFGTISLVAVITNLLVLWSVSIMFYGIMGACLLGAIFLPLGRVFAAPVRWLIDYFLTVTGNLAQFSLAAAYTKSIYVVIWLVFCYVLLAVFLLSKGKRLKILACCCVLGLCAALLASWWEPAQDTYRMTVLDVGQGQCVLFEGRGRRFLIDCGGEGDSAVANLAADTLLSQGIARLDGLILTHYDRDHAGAVANLLCRIPTSLLFLPNARDETGCLEEILTYAGNAKQILVNQDYVLNMGDIQLTLYASEIAGMGNESSLAVLVQCGDWDALITGDRTAFAERLLLNRVELPKLELLVVGHHGSNTSTCRELLEATRPTAAVISVGADNSFGHPAQAVLERLEEFGCTVYRTDQDGTLVFRG